MGEIRHRSYCPANSNISSVLLELPRRPLQNSGVPRPQALLVAVENIVELLVRMYPLQWQPRFQEVVASGSGAVLWSAPRSKMRISA